jgi:3-deoxy-D-manno-octulosonate 8-phosphate phosphatase (KDO 8-P phosphatase)
VLTDGSLILDPSGEMLRTMNIKDGYAMQWAVKKGYGVWVITGARSEAVRLRLQNLGVHEVHIGIESKTEILQDIIARTGSALEECLYMGDDIPDFEPMQLCGLPCCPADAVEEIKAVSKYASPITGGRGCVRDVIEKVLKLRGDWAVPSGPRSAF